MAREYSDYKAGEHSPVETHEVSNKSQTHQAIVDKMGSHHVIVKHNGKVIATIHPQQNEARPEFKAHDGEGNVEQKDRVETWRTPKTRSGGQTFGGHLRTSEYKSNRLTKGEAIEHAQNQIAKHGGFSGHNVELHFIGKDMRLEQVTLRKTDAVKELLEFYMGKNTMERQNFIIDNLVIEEDLAS